MPLFAFKAMSDRGAEVSDTIEARDKESAQAELRRQGYFVSSLLDVPQGSQERTRDGQSPIGAPPPGSRLQRQLIDGQLALFLPPSTGVPVGFLGCFPVMFLGAIIFVTVGGLCVGIEEKNAGSLCL